MTANRRLPVWLVWAALIGASLLGFVLAESAAAARLAASMAVLLAVLKINLVFDQYMELNWRHQPLRLFLATWLGVVTATLLGGLWLVK